MESRIEFERVSRDYGPVRGLNDVTLKIAPGVTGLLGPNGAGKSTLIRLVTGQIRPDIGAVRVLGDNPFGNPRVLARLGCCPDIDRFNDDWSGLRYVRSAAYLSGHSRAAAEKRARDLLALVGLADAATRPLGSYSKGMRQRAKLAQALVNDPEVFVLDEPLNGLDPLGRRRVIDLMRALGDAGRTVLVSSHVLHEIEAMTDQVVLIHHGKVLAEGRVSDIRSLLSRHPLQVRFEAADPRILAARVIRDAEVAGIRFEDSTVTVETRDPERLFRAVESLVLDDGLDVARMQTRDESLEAVFDYLVR